MEKISPQMLGILMVAAVLVIAFFTTSSGNHSNYSNPQMSWGMPQPARRFSGGSILAWLFMVICTILLVYGLFRSPEAIAQILITLVQDLGGGQ